MKTKHKLKYNFLSFLYIRIYIGVLADQHIHHFTKIYDLHLQTYVKLIQLLTRVFYMCQHTVKKILRNHLWGSTVFFLLD
jgi:hypothetical protein